MPSMSFEVGKIYVMESIVQPNVGVDRFFKLFGLELHVE